MTKFDPQSILSKRTAAVEEAAIIRMAQKAREMTANGHDIISLTLGEPDFDTPQHICNAATNAMNDGFTHYAPIPGMVDMRKRLAKKFKDENQLNYDWTQIVLSNGAKQSITNAIFALVDEGDEVILLAPYWVAYEGVIRMAGGIPVIVYAGIDDGFKPPKDRLASAFTDKTKLLIINSPNNPTGAMFSKSELEDIADIIRSHPRAMIISDEIYEYINFDEQHVSIGTLAEMADRTITVNGFSKGFAMTGWRLGYAGAPAPVAKAMSKVQGTFTAGCNPFVQKAAIAALDGPREAVEKMRQAYLERRDQVARGLNAMPGISAPSPAGTFYIFPDISTMLGVRIGNHTIETGEDLCDWLLETHHIATVPGSAFGETNALRISFATSKEVLTKAMERLSKAFAEIQAIKKPG
jgi:aspartate aminotransferase